MCNKYILLIVYYIISNYIFGLVISNIFNRPSVTVNLSKYICKIVETKTDKGKYVKKTHYVTSPYSCHDHGGMEIPLPSHKPNYVNHA